MKRPEILAPAGSMETLTAALRSGADAVYIGGKNFSARSSASNFTDEELAEASDLCHKYGAKLYLAVNTIISDDEAADLCRFIRISAKAGVDAYIVQDWGAAELIRRCVPDAVLHASTQMSVHTAAGAEMLRDLGWERVVPARELDRDTIRRIRSCGIETEIFVHGALCMSVSGQCYMSALMGGRSANRGCCGQACRLPFSADGTPGKASLSLKDLSLIPEIASVAEDGIDSLKIEGRMKRPEYVASAVNELKKALDGETPDMQLLRGIFSRSGFTDGYFSGKRRDMFGVREKEDVTAAKELIPKIHELYRFERKVSEISFHAVIREDMPFSLTASCEDDCVTVTGDMPQKAINRPIDEAYLEKQLSKLGDTIFTPGKVSLDTTGGLTVTAGKINELRRIAAEKLTQLIIKKNTPSKAVTDYSPQLPVYSPEDVPCPLPVRTYCRTAQQAAAAAELSEFIIVEEKAITDELLGSVDRNRIIISPPRFITDEDKTIKKLSELKALGLDRIFCHTPDHIAIGKKLGMKLHGSATLNIFNSFSAEKMKQLGLEDIVCSFEAKASQINGIFPYVPAGAVIYGRLPLMLTRNCPIRNEVGCSRCTGSLTDRTGRKLPVMCSGEYVEILNSDTLYMADKINSLKGISFGIVMLSDENEEETKAAVSGIRPDRSVTHGLYFRGVTDSYKNDRS
ncbi:MAG: U32 family peptidase [Ruminococcus sp.]|nr:U32 family peptidase [Ruminococcus sp.]